MVCGDNSEEGSEARNESKDKKLIENKVLEGKNEMHKKEYKMAEKATSFNCSNSTGSRN